MLKRLILLSLASGALLLINSINFSGCSSEPVSVIPERAVSFDRDILPIFAQNCAVHGCHDDASSNNDRLDLSSWNSLMIGGYRIGAAIVPYNAFWSGLVAHINLDTNLSLVALEPRMPKVRPPINGTPLPQNQVNLIIQWINQGAKNDEGTVAYNNISHKAFITNQAADLVAVVNTDNNFLVRLIPVGGRQGSGLLAVPHHVTVDNQGRYFYVCLIAEGYVEKYDAVTYERVGRLYTGSSPAEVFLTDDGNIGYLTNWDASGIDRSVKVIDTQDMTLLTTISSIRMYATHGGRVTHNNDFFLALSQQSEYVSIINTSDNQIQNEFPVAENVPPNGNGSGQYFPYSIAVSIDDRYAFISCPRSNEVRVLDITNGSITNIIHVGNYPLMLEVSPDGRYCYVPCRNENTVYVIDTETMTILKIIEDVGVQPHGVDFTSDGHYAYVTCESNLNGNPYLHHPLTGSNKPGTTAVIDVWADHTKIKDIEMASFPNGISITPGRGN